MTRHGHLDLYDVETSLAGPSSQNGKPAPSTSLYDLLSGKQAAAKKGSPSAYYLFDQKTHQLVFGPSGSRATVRTDVRLSGKHVPRQTVVLAVPQNQAVVNCGQNGDRFCPGVNQSPPRRISYYLFKHTSSKSGGGPFPQMTGADLSLGGIRSGFDENNNPEVLLSLTNKGSGKFQKITKAEYQRGQRKHSPQHFALVLDGDIKSFPQIDYTDPALADGISGGGRITGIGSIREARDLAIVLQTGALPVYFVQIP